MTVTVQQLENYTAIDYSTRDSSLTDPVINEQIRQAMRLISEEVNGRDISLKDGYDAVCLDIAKILMHNLQVDKGIIDEPFRSIYQPNVFKPILKYKRVAPKNVRQGSSTNKYR